MKLNKPKFWDNKIGFISILLFPLSIIFLLVTFFKKGFSKEVGFQIPIICVGNIYIGGTGKTPSSIFLANELSKMGRKPVILRKYYQSHRDEYDLIKSKFKNLILIKDRKQGIIEAQKSNNDTVILDDGFQDFKIKKDLNIICFNSNQLLGNGLILPSGPLRQNLSALKNANIILINGDQDKKFEEKILKVNNDLKIFYSFYEPENIDQFKGKKLLAIAGIGNPENFFQMIEKNGLTIQKKLVFPDHYIFSKNEIKNIINEAENNNYKIVMTEKDYFKVKDFNLEKLYYLKISLKVKEREKFLSSIKKIYEKTI